MCSYRENRIPRKPYDRHKLFRPHLYSSKFSSKKFMFFRVKEKLIDDVLLDIYNYISAPCRSLYSRVTWLCKVNHVYITMNLCLCQKIQVRLTSLQITVNGSILKCSLLMLSTCNLFENFLFYL